MYKAILPLALIAIATIALLSYNYESQTGPVPNWTSYKFVQADGQVLTRTQKQKSNYGEETALEANSDDKKYQQTFIALPQGSSTDTFRFVMVGDAGESLALTAYSDTNDVFVRTNLIEDKLDKWWKVTLTGDNKGYLQNTATDLKNTYLCGAQVAATNNAPECTWSFVQSDL